MSTTVRLLGHRGASANAPENTRTALRRALEDGADGVEVDVRLLGDGTPVLLHDETVDRTTDGAGPLGALDAVALDALDAGAWFDPKFAGERVPTLDAVLDELLPSAFLALELKEPLPEDTFRAIADRARADREAEILLGSYRLEILAAARDHAPAVARALVLGRAQPPPPDRLLEPLGLRALFAPVENVDERLVVDCRRSGLELWAFPVNDPETAARFAGWGVAGLVSDDPGAIRPVIPRSG